MPRTFKKVGEGVILLLHDGGDGSPSVDLARLEVAYIRPDSSVSLVFPGGHEFDVSVGTTILVNVADADRWLERHNFAEVKT